jgi:23S rRNA pseudouridine1911/1915/1917 synthase
MMRDHHHSKQGRKAAGGGKDSTSSKGEPAPGSSDGDEASTGGLVLPGGKITAESVQRAVDQAIEQGIEDDAALRTVRLVLKRDLNKRLDKYLVDRIGFMSRNQVQKLIDEGGVTVNDKPAKASTNLRGGDVVEVVVPPPPPSNIQPEDIPLDVLFEDEHMIVLNKQPDIIVHPARSHLKGTMLSALAFYFAHRSPKGGDLSKVGEEFARPGVVHRLDRHTSGCIVFAKKDEAHWKLGHQFEHRRVDKRYIAFVEGWVEPDVQVIEAPIGPHPSREKGYREKYVVRHDELGKHAVTICRVRERYDLRRPEARELAHAAPAPVLGWNAAAAPVIRSPSPSSRSNDGKYSLVELELKTGRTHQIRVHLSYLGWPIVGDDMYGGKPFASANGEPLITRQALHACVLGIAHPVTEAKMEFTAPLRGDMAALAKQLRTQGSLERIEAPGATVNLEWAIGSKE